MGALRSLLSTLLVLVGLLLAAAAAPATWAREHLMDTDAWSAAVAPLIAEPEIQRTVSDALVAAVDSDAQMPAFARELLSRTTDAVVATDTFATAWRNAVTISHAHLVETVRGENTGIDASQGVVSVDLGVLFEALVPRLDAAGITGVERLTTPEGQIVLEDSAETARALEIAGDVDAYAWPMAGAAVVVLACAVFTARRRGRSLLVIGAGVVLVAVVEMAAWRLLESRWTEAGGDPSGQVLLQALTGSVEGWLLRLGAAGVVAVVLGLVGVWASGIRGPNQSRQEAAA